MIIRKVSTFSLPPTPALLWLSLYNYSPPSRKAKEARASAFPCTGEIFSYIVACRPPLKVYATTNDIILWRGARIHNVYCQALEMWKATSCWSWWSGASRASRPCPTTLLMKLVGRKSWGVYVYFQNPYKRKKDLTERENSIKRHNYESFSSPALSAFRKGFSFSCFLGLGLPFNGRVRFLGM